MLICSNWNSYSIRINKNVLLPCFSQAFKTIKGFISKLEKVSEDPDLEQEYGEYDNFLSMQIV